MPKTLESYQFGQRRGRTRKYDMTPYLDGTTYEFSAEELQGKPYGVKASAAGSAARVDAKALNEKLGTNIKVRTSFKDSDSVTDENGEPLQDLVIEAHGEGLEKVQDHIKKNFKK